MKTFNLIKWAAVIGCVCSGGLVSPAGALVLTLDHSAFLGELAASRTGQDKKIGYIDQWAHTAPGRNGSGQGNNNLAVGNLLGSLPVSEFEVNPGHAGMVLDGSCGYLVARYGSTTLAWSLDGLTGDYKLPASYRGKRGVSHELLFRPAAVNAASAATPSPNGANVPDGGSTLALMGLSLASLGLLRGRFRKPQRSLSK